MLANLLLSGAFFELLGPSPFCLLHSTPGFFPARPNTEESDKFAAVIGRVPQYDSPHTPTRLVGEDASVFKQGMASVSFLRICRDKQAHQGYRANTNETHKGPRQLSSLQMNSSVKCETTSPGPFPPLPVYFSLTPCLLRLCFRNLPALEVLLLFGSLLGLNLLYDHIHHLTITIRFLHRLYDTMLATNV